MSFCRVSLSWQSRKCLETFIKLNFLKSISENDHMQQITSIWTPVFGNKSSLQSISKNIPHVSHRLLLTRQVWFTCLPSYVSFSAGILIFCRTYLLIEGITIHKQNTHSNTIRRPFIQVIYIILMFNKCLINKITKLKLNSHINIHLWGNCLEWLITNLSDIKCNT